MINEKGGVKFDGQKVKPTLFLKSLNNAVSSVQSVLDYGAKKYTRTVEIDIDNFKENLIRCISVSDVVKKNTNLPKISVVHVTEEKLWLYQNAHRAEKLDKLQVKIENVDLAMKETDLLIYLKNKKQGESIKRNTDNLQSSNSKRSYENNVDDPIPNTSQSKKFEQLLDDLLSTELLSSNTEFYVTEGVQCVEARNVHILITTIRQENSEICFVVIATKLLDCYKTILALLQVYWNTSLNINLTKVLTGENNWVLVEPERYDDAALRHIQAYLSGELNDPESGKPHLAHALCCLMFRLELDLRKSNPT